MDEHLGMIVLLAAAVVVIERVVISREGVYLRRRFSAAYEKLSSARALLALNGRRGSCNMPPAEPQTPDIVHSPPAERTSFSRVMLGGLAE